MKKIQYYNRKVMGFISLILIVLLIEGCGKVLDDVQNLASYPAAGTFDDLLTANAFTANLYASTLGGWPINMGNNSDEGGGILGDGWITTDNTVMKFWPYTTIRKINILLKEIPAGKIAADKQGPFIGQAKFLRAFNYFKMVYYYGGVPIIQVPQELTSDLMVKRNTTAECFDFIIKDLDEAAALLPVKYTGTDRGKIDQAIIKAFKGRVLLYKASPQFNSANPYGNAYWATAYTANKEAKDFLDANGYGLLDDYTKVFETKGHKENILSVIYSNPAKTNGRGEDGLRPLSESKNATGNDQPIWSMVQAFPMKDGKKPGDPTSAYTYNIQTYWKNRDPRFDATIVWNGAIYELSGIKGRRQYTMYGIAKSMDAWGYSMQGESYPSRTGVYCRKGIMEELASTQVALNDIDWPEIRYAEVLFNYAESANETGKTSDALDVLKAIRKRAGIEAGGDGMYGLKTGMSRDEMRTAIFDEKRVEFMFEGQRFWDLRRQRMFGSYLNGMRKYGIMTMTVNGHTSPTADDILKGNAFQLVPEDFTYSIEEQITNGPKQMVMPDKYYFFPIQLSNINQNANLKQNKDWGGDFNPEL